jgi:2-amino-4-hydroxy-6-hydroxymethyldihydropteridine diphosphokinase
MPRAGIALGSNLGDRLEHLRAAVAALRLVSTAGSPVLAAPIYQTQARDCPPGSPDFLNTVIEIEFAGTAAELLAQTRALETRLGRSRNATRNAPRVIDIDLLYVGDSRCANPNLVLPHPGNTQRRFVLQPLCDIRPDLVLPGQSLTIASLLANMDSDEAPPKRMNAGI